ncbi:MAG: non-ribosomal peptide synthetase, partial [Candidatus Binatia bacterium]
MKSLTERIANLSPERRALLELRLKQKGALAITTAAKEIIPRPADGGPPPVSFGQRLLWFLDQLEPGNSLFNIPSAVRLEGVLDVEALKKALDTVVARHAVLRTAIAMGDGIPVQVVNDMRAVNLPIVDLSNEAETERQAQLRRILNAEARRPFDLSRDLMLRAALIRLAPADHVLVLVTHHIASDGWSIEILFRELGVLCQAFSKGELNPLAEPSVQYSDYAAWQHQWLQGKMLETQLAYWKQQLSGISLLELPTDRPRPAVKSYHGAVQSLMIPPSLANQLKTMSRDHGVTLFMVLLAAFETLLHRYTGQQDITVGSPIAGRIRPEIEQLIGFFVNTLVLRSDLSGNPTFLELVGRVREVCLDAYSHQDLPFDKLVEELHPERTLGNSPLFQVMFAHENVPTENLELPGVTVTPLQVHNGTAMVDLTLTTRLDSGGLAASLEYSTDLLDDATISRMLKHFETLLEGIVAGPNRRLSELPLLTDTERQELLVQWNDTKRDYPKDGCIHELFEAQVERTPDVVAAVFEGRQLTYRELNSRANRLAHYLIKLGVGPDVPVTLSVERSLEMLVGVLGILKAGAAYVPLDPAYPPERLVFMVDDIRAPVLLTERQFAASLATQHAATISLDTDWEVVAAESTENPSGRVKPGNSACVIYTSGSTGKPKGVEVTHGGLVNYVVHAADVCGLAPGDRVLQFSSISFDTAAEEIFCSLTSGATLVMRNDTMLSSVSDFLQACAKWGITALDLPTAYWHEITARLFSEGLAMPDEIRLVIVGGERAIPERLTQWRACIGNRIRLWNSYGPTETTIAATLCELTGGSESEKSFGEVSIGGPIPNVQLYVSDQDLNPVPAG